VTPAYGAVIIGSTVSVICSMHAIENRRPIAVQGQHDQERPQDFGWGVNAPLPPQAKKTLEI